MPWQDVLHDGPVPAGLTQEELRDVRARFLADCGWTAYEAAYALFSARDRLLAAGGQSDEIVLYLERDLFDQLQLLQILDRLGARRAAIADLGDPTRLTTLAVLERFDLREPVSPAQKEAGRRAWRAFTAPDPRAIEDALGVGLDELPHVTSALRRHLEELPWTTDGLARSERQLLAAVAAGAASRADAFENAQEREERRWLGDTSAWLRLDRLVQARQPLLRADGDRYELTRAGADALAGRADFVRLNGVERWLGGVHLTGSYAAWRWDADAGRVVEGTW